MTLHTMPAWQIRHLVATRQVSPVEIVNDALARAEHVNRDIHALVTICADEALIAAREAEAAVMRGEVDAPLLGVPFTAKDVLDSKGVRTTYGSRAFADHVPTEDAIVVARMKKAGAILVGKGNTAEFGLSWRTMNRIGEECRNPWNWGHVAGGSSGGDAAAVAAGMVPVSLGTDRGGSGRLPAAWCGVSSLRSSFGVMTTEGTVVPTAFYCGTSPIAASVRDMCTLYEVVSASVSGGRRLVISGRPAHRGLWSISGTAGGVRVGWSTRPEEGVTVDAGVLACFLTALDKFAAEGLCAQHVEWPRGAEYRDAYWLLNDADRETFLGARLRALQVPPGDLSEYVVRRLTHGANISAGDVCRALVSRHEYQCRVDSIFEAVDIVLTPTVAITAPPVSATLTLDRDIVTGFTWPMNFADICAITVPAGVVDGLPVGIQIAGPKGSEWLILMLAAEIEQICVVDRPLH